MMIGDLIDHYRVLELVGRGAMGVVYKALDVNIDRPVAIKVMSAEARGDPSFVERSLTRTSRCSSTTLYTRAHPLR